MKAIEFIKKFGWSAAISFVEDNISAGDVYDHNMDKYIYTETDWSDLKKYTDAYELVQSYGGLVESKRAVELKSGLVNLEGWDSIERAIAIVEEVGDCDE